MTAVVLLRRLIVAGVGMMAFRLQVVGLASNFFAFGIRVRQLTTHQK